jgi:O-antigen/teichoic acid export membrane protein
MSVPKPALPAVPMRTGWRSTVETALRSENQHSSRIVGGSLIMLMGSGVVSAGNFGYNVVIARLLGPARFGDTSALVTLLMLASAITLSFQLVCAKFVARNESRYGKAEVYRSLRRRAWLVGIALGAALALFSRPLTDCLRLPSPWLMLLLGMGIAFYVPLGVKRGGLQGTCAFGQLSANFILEVAVKFLGALLLVELGFGVTGAVAAIAASVVIAYLVPLRDELLDLELGGSPIPASFREGMQAIVFFVGQVLINNIDILLVKHFFQPEDAGLYAAVALVGRVVYFASWSVVSAMFPIAAGQKPTENNISVLVVPLLFVVFIAVVFILVLQFLPGVVMRFVFGPGFAPEAPLLSLYAAATGAYSLSVVLIAFEMSRKLANTGLLQLLFSGLVIAGISLFHSSLRQVIIVQLVLMVLLLIAVWRPVLRMKKSLANPQEAA